MALNMGTAVAYLEMDTSAFTNGLQVARQGMETFISSTQSAEGKIKGLSNTLNTAGSGLTKSVTLPIVGIGTAAVKTASDFEAGMSKVKAISGATGSEFDNLREKALEMGAKTKFSATESASAFEYMAMAGWKTNDMLEGIEGVMNLAAASGEDLALVSDIVTDALTAFGLSAKDTGNFVDVLAAASANSNTNVSMLGESFKYVAPVAGTLGFTIEDTAVALGLMANNGIKASQSGTALRSGLTRLTKPTKTMVNAMVELGLATQDFYVQVDEGKVEKAQRKVEDRVASMEKAQIKYNQALEKYGESSSQAQTALINLETAQRHVQESMEDLETAQQGTIEQGELHKLAITDESGQMRELSEVMDILRDKFSGLTEAEKAEKAAVLFGQEAMAGMLSIINASEEDYNKLTEAIKNSSGSTQEMSDIMMDNLAGSLTILKSTLESASIEIGDKFAPYVRQLADYITDLVSKFNALSPEQQDQIIKWALMAAAVGPVLIVLSKVIGMVGTVIGAVGKIASGIVSAVSFVGKAISGIGSVLTFVAANPIVLVIAAIAALVAGIVYLWNTSEDFQNFWKGLWENVSSFVKGAGEAIGGFFTETIPGFFEGVLDSMGGFGESMKEFFTETIPDAFGSFLDGLGGIGESIGDFFTKTIPGFFKGVKLELPEAVTSIPGKVADVFGGIGEKLGEKKDQVGSDIENFLITAGEKTSEFIGFITEPFEGIGETIGGFFSSAYETIGGWGEKIGNAVGGAFSGLSEKVSSAFGGVESVLSNFNTHTVTDFITNFDISELPYKIGYATGQMIGHIYLFGQDAISWAKNDLPDIIGNIADFFGELPEKVGGWFDKTSEKVVDWGGDILKKGGDAASKFIDNVGKTMSDLPDNVGSILSDAYENVTTWGGNLFEKAIEIGSGFLTNFVGIVTDLPGKTWDIVTDTYKNVTQWGGDMISKAFEIGSDFMGNLFDFLSQLPGKAMDLFGEAYANATEWGGNMIDKAIETGSGFVDSFISFVTEMPGKVMEFFGNLYDDVTTWGGNLIENGIEIAGNFVENFVDFLKDLPGNVMDIVKSVPERIKGMKNDMLQAGKDMLGGMFEGIKNVGKSIMDWFGRFFDSIGGFIRGIVDGFQDVVNGANEAKNAARSVDGSHANGLAYVPFNGYIAELHEGERVLTKEENAAYNRGMSGTGGGDVFNFYGNINNPYENARQIKKAKQELLYGIG